jgi:hypothetical protein
MRNAPQSKHFESFFFMTISNVIKHFIDIQFSSKYVRSLMNYICHKVNSTLIFNGIRECYK